MNRLAQGLPPGWSVGVSSMGFANALFYYPEEGWSCAWCITSDGQEHEISCMPVPESVVFITRLLHRSLVEARTQSQDERSKLQLIDQLRSLQSELGSGRWDDDDVGGPDLRLLIDICVLLSKLRARVERCRKGASCPSS